MSHCTDERFIETRPALPISPHLSHLSPSLPSLPIPISPHNPTSVGAWADGSGEWTEELLAALQYEFADDGALSAVARSLLRGWRAAARRAVRSTRP